MARALSLDLRERVIAAIETGLTWDRDALLAFFDFPAEHWDHRRTTNPIDCVFVTVRHRTVRTEGALSLTEPRRVFRRLLIL